MPENQLKEGKTDTASEPTGTSAFQRVLTEALKGCKNYNSVRSWVFKHVPYVHMSPGTGKTTLLRILEGDSPEYISKPYDWEDLPLPWDTDNSFPYHQVEALARKRGVEIDILAASELRRILKKEQDKGIDLLMSDLAVASVRAPNGAFLLSNLWPDDWCKSFRYQIHIVGTWTAQGRDEIANDRERWNNEILARKNALPNVVEAPSVEEAISEVKLFLTWWRSQVLPQQYEVKK